MNDERSARHSLEDNATWQDIYCANATQCAAVIDRNRPPSNAAIECTVERGWIGDRWAKSGAEVSEKSILMVHEAEGANKRSRLLPDEVPTLAAILRSVELAIAVTVPAVGLGDEKDVVLLVRIRFRWESSPLRRQCELMGRRTGTNGRGAEADHRTPSMKHGGITCV
ncbi:MAG: hypothetical protein ABL889_00805 [Terricaulis sp.]